MKLLQLTKTFVSKLTV